MSFLDTWRMRAGRWLLKQESRVAPFSALSTGWGDGPVTDSTYLSAYTASPTVYSAVTKFAQDNLR